MSITSSKLCAEEIAFHEIEANFYNSRTLIAGGFSLEVMNEVSTAV